MIQTARKGRRAEHKSMRLFEALGYLCVRSAASKGPFDFLAVGPVDICAVQVKAARWPGAAEMETLSLLRVPPNVRRVIHRWRPRQRLPDVREL